LAPLDAGIAAILVPLSPLLVLPIAWIDDGVIPGPKAFLVAAMNVTRSALMALM